MKAGFRGVWGVWLVVVTGAHTTNGEAVKSRDVTLRQQNAPAMHEERPTEPWIPRLARAVLGGAGPRSVWRRGAHKSIQVNVDSLGRNFLGDAANEPSIAIDPTDPSRIVIGWRQFDTVQSGGRQAGWAYSHDGGQTWTFPGVLRPGVFGSDPVLDADADGNFYYHSIRCAEPGCGDLFKSVDGGVSWLAPVPTLMGDKPWMAIDRTNGIGRNNIYAAWLNTLTRSTDAGTTFDDPVGAPFGFSTIAIGPDGDVFVGGGQGRVGKSSNAKDPTTVPVFESIAIVDLGGLLGAFSGPNPGGLLGQMWIATDHSDGPSRSNVYLLGSVDPSGNDPMDTMFARSTDGGLTWSEPIRINDDPEDNGAWQWFGTMSVAPNGRIDAVWNDTRNTGAANLSELYYAFSTDAGDTWSRNIPVSPVFDSHVGWPGGQNKIGDYYDMISDNAAANVAYAATFNNEEDVYFLRIGDCNDNGIHDSIEIAAGTVEDCNANDAPDVCEPDCNKNQIPDDCDLTDGTAQDTDGNGVPDICQVPLFVSANAPGSIQDGSSWATAYRDLQDALIAARISQGIVNEIWVAAGVYKPDAGSALRGVSFQLINGVAVFGGFADSETIRDQRDPKANVTILSGDIGAPGDNTDNSYHVVTADAVDASAVLDGFTITGGNADGDDGPPGPSHDIGGGLRSVAGSPTIVNCVFTGNFGRDGGGMYSSDGAPALVDCMFEGNSAVTAGGLYYERSSPLVSGCTFRANSATSGAGGILNTVDSDATIVGCLFERNTSRSGGAIVIAASSPTINDCIFTGNSADTGGGMFSVLGGQRLSNCVFVGNTSSRNGGAVFSRRSHPSFINCTFAGNTATERAGGIFYWRESNPTLNGCILWNNQDSTGTSQTAQIDVDDSLGANTIAVDYTCIQGLTAALGGIGNIGADPLFVDPLGADGIPGSGDEDLRLTSGSPAINTGDPAFVPVAGETDSAGQPRRQGCRVDMGAYESAVLQSPGDFDGDDRFDLTDVASFQLCISAAAINPSWLDACLCVFDSDQNESINLSDFAVFQSSITGP